MDRCRYRCCHRLQLFLLPPFPPTHPRSSVLLFFCFPSSYSSSLISDICSSALCSSAPLLSILIFFISVLCFWHLPKSASHAFAPLNLHPSSFWRTGISLSSYHYLSRFFFASWTFSFLLPGFRLSCKCRHASQLLEIHRNLRALFVSGM